MLIKYLPLYLLIIGMAVSIPLTNMETRGFILDLFGGMIGHTSTTSTTTTTTEEPSGGFFGFGK